MRATIFEPWRLLQTTCLIVKGGEDISNRNALMIFGELRRLRFFDGRRSGATAQFSTTVWH
jgi:hypothetical protein